MKTGHIYPAEAPWGLQCQRGVNMNLRVRPSSADIGRRGRSYSYLLVFAREFRGMNVSCCRGKHVLRLIDIDGERGGQKDELDFTGEPQRIGSAVSLNRSRRA